ncbi:MAG: hypothetical protein CME70_23475 [Halobacteriovorax sp.]|nr:hypothetical protein [Halobacteriovorax sp.]|tara:strand:+ start:141420 stop:141959 length:540 start_codon:yes stop_codon:yes gene_type:complete
MKFKNTLLVLSLLFSFSGFTSDSTHANHGSKSDMKMKMKRKTLDDKTKAQVVKALEANEKLHSSFFKYDGKKVELSARELKMALEKVSDPELSKLLTFSKKKLGEIKGTNDRKDNNQSYHLVSMALIHVVNKYDVGKKYNAYSCPMVKKKWVQNSKTMAKVHNPYAPEMPHCGQQDSHH